MAKIVKKANGEIVKKEEVTTPQFTPIQVLELTVNSILKENNIQLLEAIGFFELKLIELKESFRGQMALRNLAAAQQAQEAQNETEN